MACDVFNRAPLMNNAEYKTPLQVLSGSDVSIYAKHFNTFASPVYVSENIQEGNLMGSGKKEQEWEFIWDNHPIIIRM